MGLPSKAEVFQVSKVDGERADAKMIRQYFDQSMTYHNNHQSVSINTKVHEISQIWEVTNLEHYIKFIGKGYDKDNTYLLWHGTHRYNLVSILRNSLRLPPLNRGNRGIYFADRVAKSLGYTNSGGPKLIPVPSCSW